MIRTATYPYIRIIFLTVGIITLFLTSSLSSIANEYLQIVMLGLIATMGLSHGSLDWLLAQHLGFRSSSKQSIIFLFCYSLIVLLGIITWWITPTLGLIIFLIMSITHFASDWENEVSSYMSYTAGFVVVALPTISYQHEVADLFSLLIGSAISSYLILFLHYTGIISVFTLLILIMEQLFTNKNRLLAIELIVLIILGLLLQPLIYFSVYFCFLHALKHWKELGNLGLFHHRHEVIFSATWPTLFCIIAGLVIYQLQSKLNLTASYIPIIFIGLASLTIPHWLLLEFYPIKSTSHG